MNQDPAKQSILEEDYRNIFFAVSEALILYDIPNGLVIIANPAACKMYGYSNAEFTGMNPAVFMHPDSYLSFMEHTRTVAPDNVVESLVVHVRKDGTPFYAEVRRSVIKFQGRPNLLSAIRDVSQRILIENKLSEQIETRRREQSMLLTISHTLASTLELQPGLILEQLHEIINFSHGGLFTIEGSTLVSMAMHGNPQLEQSPPIHIHFKDTETLVTLFNRHRPIRIEDIWGNDPQALFLRKLLSNEAAILIEGMQSWMWVPLAVKGRIIGGVGVAEIRKNYFTIHHADLALSVADQAAITMINAELYGRAQELAVLEERQRLARNLHDAVNQSLFSAGLIAEVLPRLWDRDQAEARRSLDDLRRLTRGALAEMRVLLAELRPSTLTDAELGDLLRLLGNAFTGRTNIPVILKVSGQSSLPAETQVALYRICQETLNNIGKHAKANQVYIELLHESHNLEIHIRDDGQGFDPASLRLSGHYGLEMMRERSEMVGAELKVTSQPGKGTEVAIYWKNKENL